MQDETPSAGEAPELASSVTTASKRQTSWLAKARHVNTQSFERHFRRCWPELPNLVVGQCWRSRPSRAVRHSDSIATVPVEW